MENTFFVTGCRFHTKEENTLLVTGYFRNNEMRKNRLTVLLDEKELPISVEDRRLNQLGFRIAGEQLITKQYYIWVTLPEQWKNGKQIQLMNEQCGGKEMVTTFSVADLFQVQKRIAKCIDSLRWEEDRLYIEGWYVNTNHTELTLEEMNGNPLKLEIHYKDRRDVLGEYPENTEEEIVGFYGTYDGKKQNKIKLVLKNDKYEDEEILQIEKNTFEKLVSSVNTMIFKTQNYYRQFGLEATLRRTGDKLLKREYSSYEDWVRRTSPSKLELRKQRKESFPIMPKISIVIPLYRTPEKYLIELIESIRKQSYKNWELCLSDGSGDDSPIIDMLRQYEKKDARIRIIDNKKQLHISANTNEALKAATGDYIAFADHDDLLTPDALYECVRAINEDPKIEMIYSDEDKINMDGTEYFLPHFKPDYNLEYLRGTNYFCHLVVVKRELYQKVGELNSICDGAQDYDFVLRCVEKTSHIKHIPKVLYHWRAHKDSTAGNPESKPYGVEAGRKALQAHYERLGMEAVVTPREYMGVFRSKFVIKENPLISIIIPNKDHIEDLQKCISSIEQKSTYKNIEYIVVENNSQNEETFVYYDKLQAENEKVKVVYWKEKGFNYPAINNFGVKHAKGEYLLFLNNDTEILNADCIEEMLMYAMRDDVGAVGAKMYYEDGTIQHSGVILGLGGVAGHAFLGAHHENLGYFFRAILPQNLSAVTAACMMTKRNVYEEVGGFDEAFAVAFNDVDLCLKIRQAGYLIVYTPYAELMHFESKSRGYDDTLEKRERFLNEIHLFQGRWDDLLKAGDPYYNPNLTLDRNDFSMDYRVNRKRK